MLLSTEHGDVLAGLAATTTTLSGGTAGITVLFANWIITRRIYGEGQYDLVKTMNGAVRSFELQGKGSLLSPLMVKPHTKLFFFCSVLLSIV